jgi:glycosyltransferase involved in cell wall biosynthesis
LTPGEAAPLVSVVVPTRNCAPWLSGCIASARAQTHPAIEVVVVDNTSTDGTERLGRSEADVFASTGPERSAQRNRGAELASGQYLLFVDCDMALSPGVAAACLEAIAASGAPAVIVPEVSSGEGFWARCRSLERSCYDGDDSVEAARFFRRDLFLAAGGYDPAMTGAEDWDVSIRIAGDLHLPRSRAALLHHEGRVTLGGLFAKRRYYAPGYWRFLRKHGARAVRQANPARPAYLRNWRRLVVHPMLTLGIGVMKSVEVAAVMTRWRSATAEAGAR